MKNRVNLGVIGCGSVFRLMHLPALIKLNNKFNIVSVYDTDEAAIKLTNKLFGKDLPFKIVNNPTKILSDPHIDAIAVLTSTSSHLKYTLQALRNNKHVFLEKPAAVLPKDVLKITQYEKKFNKYCQVGSPTVPSPPGRGPG